MVVVVVSLVVADSDLPGSASDRVRQKALKSPNAAALSTLPFAPHQIFKKRRPKRPPPCSRNLGNQDPTTPPSQANIAAKREATQAYDNAAPKKPNINSLSFLFRRQRHAYVCMYVYTSVLRTYEDRDRDKRFGWGGAKGEASAYIASPETDLPPTPHPPPPTPHTSLNMKDGLPDTRGNSHKAPARARRRRFPGPVVDLTAGRCKEGPFERPVGVMM